MLTFNPQDPFSCFVTQSLSMKSAVENAQRFAMFDVPLLIQGETGTGKDLLAKACHFASLRREKKFIAVNCAGLPDEDAESEMFGYLTFTPFVALASTRPPKATTLPERVWTGKMTRPQKRSRKRWSSVS